MLSGSPPKQTLALLPGSRRPCLWGRWWLQTKQTKKRKRVPWQGKEVKWLKRRFMGSKCGVKPVKNYTVSYAYTEFLKIKLIISVGYGNAEGI